MDERPRVAYGWTRSVRLHNRFRVKSNLVGSAIYPVYNLFKARDTIRVYIVSARSFRSWREISSVAQYYIDS